MARANFIMLKHTKTEQDSDDFTQGALMKERAEAEVHEQDLRASELRYRRLFEAARDGILILDVDSGCITDVNPFLVELLGFSHDEMVGRTVGELSPFKDILQNESMLEKLQKDGYVRYEHLPLETRDGRKIEVEFISNVYQAGEKNVIQCNIRDNTEHYRMEGEIERLSRLYAALSHINQSIVTSGSREELFSKICRVLVEVGEFRIAWVGWLDEKTQQILPVAHWGDENNVLSQMTFYADDRPEGQGPTGRAIREGRNVICNDFSRDPDTWLWRDATEKAGVQSSASLLIQQGGVTCGTITVYAGQTDFFHDKEIALLEEAAINISFALSNFVREDARQKAEAELRWKTAFLEAQVDSTPDGILVVNNDGKTILQNQRMTDLWDIPPEFSENSDDSAQVKFASERTKYPQKFVKKVAHLYAHPEEISRDEIELVDGTFLDRYSAPVSDKDGKYYGRIWSFRDITRRKQSEAALVESKRFLGSTLDALSAHIAILDEHGTIIEVNTAWKNFAGQNQFIGSDRGKNTNYLHICDTASGKFSNEAPAVARGIRSIIAGECELFTLEYPCHAPNEKRWFTLRITRFRGDGPVRVVVAHENITERKFFEQQMRQSQKMEAIGTLAGGVAHDFNNILAAIQMQAELLIGSGELSETQSELATDIGTAVQRAAGLTRQLLLFSRKEVLQLRDIDLNLTVIEMTKMLKRILGENIEVLLTLSSQPMFLHADAGMMDQVLMNLAVNARDAMPKGGKLLIETKAVEFDAFAARQIEQGRSGSFTCLSVSDDGYGIPPEHLSKIFEPFFTTKDVGKGTGLGLATIFGIVQQHQGWIDVYSEVDHGTTFKVYLPRLSKESDLKKLPENEPKPETGNETILLVEDEPILRTTISIFLSHLGYRVLDAATAVKTLDIWKEHAAEIDLVLTDFMMPGGMTGKELGQTLLQENPKLKVIYMSGYSADIVAKDFHLEEGFNYLGKPFQSQKLGETIRKRLRTSGQ